ncbi:MAG: AMP-binding protein, partial [Promethearchaeota archaeon]
RGYKSFWVYIPSKISKDSSFPFKDKEEVIIEMEGGSLIVRKIYNLSEITKKYGIADASLPKLVEKKALDNKNLPFIYFRDNVYSYQDTNKISNQIANGLLKLIKKLNLSKPKIALLFPSCPEFIFCWFGIAKAGCVLISVSYFLESDLLEFVLKNSDTEILIIDYEYFPKFKKICTKLPNIKKVIINNVPNKFNFNDKLIDFQEILSNNSKNPNLDIKSFHPLEILYTSGTTGKPKGVLYRNYYTLAGISVGNELEEIGFNHIPHKIYCSLPLFQAFAQYMVIIPAIFYNISIIIPEKFDVSKFWDDINKYKPSGFCYYRALLSSLVNQPPKDTDRKHSVKYAFGGGAIKKIWETFERRFGIQIIEIWSLVEAIGMSINKVGSKGGKIGSVGKPLRGFDIKIVDLNGNELPPGRNNIGEIIARPTLPFELEYYNLVEESTTKIGQNRWVYTGDFGYKDQEDFIYFLGRRTDMLRKDGEIFFAIDIEIVANSHPLVIESAVFEVPEGNSSNNEFKICAVIKKGATINHQSFYQFLTENLAYFMVPRYIEFKKELPKNDNELIKKFILKKEWGDIQIRKKTYDVKIQNFLK